MELQTIRQYAKEHHVSYEAVRQTIKAHEKELEGHIVTQNGTRYLDEEAVDFLTQRRRKNVVVVRTEDREAEIQALKTELEKAKEQLAAAQTELLRAQQRIIDIQAEQTPLIEARARYELQTEQLEETRTMLKETRQELADLREADTKIISDLMHARDEAQTEANSYQRTWFGLYPKK